MMLRNVNAIISYHHPAYVCRLNIKYHACKCAQNELADTLTTRQGPGSRTSVCGSHTKFDDVSTPLQSFSYKSKCFMSVIHISIVSAFMEQTTSERRLCSVTSVGRIVPQNASFA